MDSKNTIDILLPVRKALFLDRDGVVNTDHGYVYKIKDFQFRDGIFEFAKLFAENGYFIFIITNQSGIGRKYYSEEDFQILTEWMLEKFKRNEIDIDGVFHCPHSPEDKCRCRKPDIGMIEKVMERFPVDLTGLQNLLLATKGL